MAWEFPMYCFQSIMTLQISKDRWGTTAMKRWVVEWLEVEDPERQDITGEEGYMGESGGKQTPGIGEKSTSGRSGRKYLR